LRHVTNIIATIMNTATIVIVCFITAKRRIDNYLISDIAYSTTDAISLSLQLSRSSSSKLLIKL